MKHAHSFCARAVSAGSRGIASPVSVKVNSAGSKGHVGDAEALAEQINLNTVAMRCPGFADFTAKVENGGDGSPT